MVTLTSGLVVLLVTAVALGFMLPRGGKPHRFVGTEAEPYVAVVFTAFVALGFTLILSGVIELLGA